MMGTAIAKQDRIGARAVSYTHLDVYKRQGEGLECRAGHGLGACKEQEYAWRVEVIIDIKCVQIRPITTL